jgi:hypothetical protein
MAASTRAANWRCRPISYRREELKRSFVVLSISEDLLGWDGSQRWL